MQNISVLCTSKNSIYNELGLETYDQKRDARTYNGSGPIIAHPPCRAWSAHMSHFAKPLPGEKSLALFCLRKIAKNGGVLEHPANSKFFEQYNLHQDIRFKIIEIHQSWFGYPTTKRTWLLMPKHYKIPEYPFSLQRQGKEKQIFENMSHNQRSKTTLELAKWLINLVEQNQ